MIDGGVGAPGRATNFFWKSVTRVPALGAEIAHAFPAGAKKKPPGPHFFFVASIATVAPPDSKYAAVSISLAVASARPPSSNVTSNCANRAPIAGLISTTAFAPEIPGTALVTWPSGAISA
jgi:hypothetical protein